MAKGRFISRNISLSEKVADLSISGQLLYTWMIVHSDDFGLLQASPRTIKAQVIPMWDIKTDDVQWLIEEMTKSNLVQIIKVEGDEFYYIANSDKNQKLRRDINPSTILPVTMGKETADNWEKCEKLIRDVTESSVTRSQVKLSKDKLREVKLSKVTVNGVLQQMPDVTTQKEQQELISKDILKELKDKQSEKFYNLVASKIPEGKIRQFLAEVRQDKPSSPPKVFTFKVMKYANGL